MNTNDKTIAPLLIGSGLFLALLFGSENSVINTDTKIGQYLTVTVVALICALFWKHVGGIMRVKLEKNKEMSKQTNGTARTVKKSSGKKASSIDSSNGGAVFVLVLVLGCSLVHFSDEPTHDESLPKVTELAKKDALIAVLAEKNVQIEQQAQIEKSKLLKQNALIEKNSGKLSDMQYNIETKNWPNARSLAYSVLKTDTDNASAINGLGKISFFTEEYDLALAFWKDARELDPTDTRYLENIGNAHFELGNFPNALESFTDLRKLNPKRTDLHYSIGRTYLRDNKWDKAYEHLTKEAGSYGDGANDLLISTTLIGFAESCPTPVSTDSSIMVTALQHLKRGLTQDVGFWRSVVYGKRDQRQSYDSFLKYARSHAINLISQIDSGDFEFEEPASYKTLSC